jgi:dihydroneopterin aldolase
LKSDRILIENLQLEAVIGVYEQERYKKQKLILTLEIYTDIKMAAEADDIDHAIDYAEIAQEISTLVEFSRFQLVETLAEHILQLVMKKFGVKKVSLVLKKPQALKNAASVSVIMAREC